MPLMKLCKVNPNGCKKTNLSIKLFGEELFGLEMPNTTNWGEQFTLRK